MFHTPSSRPAGERLSDLLHIAIAALFGLVATTSLIVHLTMLPL